jgi:hypothetical protein
MAIAANNPHRIFEIMGMVLRDSISGNRADRDSVAHGCKFDEFLIRPNLGSSSDVGDLT